MSGNTQVKANKIVGGFASFIALSGLLYATMEFSRYINKGNGKFGQKPTPSDSNEDKKTLIQRILL